MSDKITGTELVVRETPRRHLRLRLFTLMKPGSGRRRVWSRMTDLERDLAHSQELNRKQASLIEQLTAELTSATSAAWNAIDRADALERQLQLAIEANDANTHRIDVTFTRDVDLGDDATYPVPVAEMREELSHPDEDVTSLVTLADERSRDHDDEELVPISQSTTGTFHVVSLHHSPMAGTSPINIPIT